MSNKNSCRFRQHFFSLHGCCVAQRELQLKSRPKWRSSGSSFCWDENCKKLRSLCCSGRLCSSKPCWEIFRVWQDRFNGSFTKRNVTAIKFNNWNVICRLRKNLLCFLTVNGFFAVKRSSSSWFLFCQMLTKLSWFPSFHITVPTATNALVCFGFFFSSSASTSIQTLVCCLTVFTCFVFISWSVLLCCAVSH